MTIIRTLCVALVLAAGCYTTSTTATTFTESSIPTTNAPRTGSVESVREVVQRVQGRPVGGAVAGGLIGGAIFHSGAGALFGALTGAAVSSGGSETRTYEVWVRFDDGDSGKFVYRDYAPWRPGDRVVLTRNGLYRG